MKSRNLQFIAFFIILNLCCPFTATGKEVLRIGHHWGADDPEGRSVHAVIEYYEDLHPEVEVEAIQGLWPMDKLYMLIAAGEPPDVMIGLGSDVAEFVRKDMLVPLGAYAKRDGVKANSFWPPAWEGVTFSGELWGLPAWVDPNFALLANPQLLAEAGIPADRPPQTIPELDAAMERLIRFDSDGRATQLGMRPWTVYSPWNTLVTWTWAINGDTQLYDEVTRRTAVNSPSVLRAMTWVADKYARYGKAPSDASFPNGRLGLELITGGTNIRDYMERVPDLIAGPTPYHPDAGTDCIAWAGGHIMVVLKGARNIQKAWDFLVTVSGSGGGAMTWAKWGRITGYREASAIAYLRQDPAMRIMVSVMEKAAFIRPRIPIDSIDDRVRPYLDRIWQGVVSPRGELENMNDMIQAQVNAWYDRLGK